MAENKFAEMFRNPNFSQNPEQMAFLQKLLAGESPAPEEYFLDKDNPAIRKVIQAKTGDADAYLDDAWLRSKKKDVRVNQTAQAELKRNADAADPFGKWMGQFEAWDKSRGATPFPLPEKFGANLRDPEFKDALIKRLGGKQKYNDLMEAVDIHRMIQGEYGELGSSSPLAARLAQLGYGIGG